MAYIQERHNFEKHEKEMTTLYRYLGVKYRISNPMSKDKVKVNKKLKNELDKAICEAAVDYFKEGLYKPEILEVL